MLGDRRVDHALRAELVQHALADLVGALILAHFLAHQEDVGVAAHLFLHGGADRLAHRHGHHLGAFGNFRRGVRFSVTRCRCAATAETAGSTSAFDLALRLCFGFGCRSGIRLANHGDGRVHLHVLGAGGNEDRGKRALVDGFHFHRGLVGLDLGDHVAGLHHVAHVLEPLGKLALFHGGRESGHENRWHCASSPSGVHVDVGIELGSIGLRIILREFGGFRHHCPDIGIDLLQIFLGRKLAVEDAAFTCSIGSCSSRIFCTSSLERYFAGSDIEWPR
jgi:hypothetical protein